jgi:hypothetical protein
MTPGQTAALRLPSFLHGTFRSVRQKARREGLRCGAQYRKDGTLPIPRQRVEVPPGEVVVAHDVVDFQHERPAWRLYMVSNVLDGLLDAVEQQNTLPTRDAYETVCLETTWGALSFALAQMGPVSAERTAKRAIEQARSCRRHRAAGSLPAAEKRIRTERGRFGVLWPREPPAPCFPENGLGLASLVDVYKWCVLGVHLGVHSQV